MYQRKDSVTGCFSYEPAVVNLKGVIDHTTFTGPPNYESIKDGDQPETYRILYVNKPICVEGKGGGNDDPDAQPENNVSHLQMNMDEKQYDQYKDLLGKQVSVPISSLVPSPGTVIRTSE